MARTCLVVWLSICTHLKGMKRYTRCNSLLPIVQFGNQKSLFLFFGGFLVGIKSVCAWSLAARVTFSCCAVAEYPWKWLTNTPKRFSPANSKNLLQARSLTLTFQTSLGTQSNVFYFKEQIEKHKWKADTSYLRPCDILTSPFIFPFLLPVDRAWLPDEQRHKAAVTWRDARWRMFKETQQHKGEWMRRIPWKERVCEVCHPMMCVNCRLYG